MKRFLSIVTILTVIIYACCHADLISESCSLALALWYNSVVPVILPFMLIAGLAASSLSGAAKPLTAYLMIFATGLLCGFPTGTIVISAFCSQGLITRRKADVLMPLCNNVSPMFLYGYIYLGYMSDRLSLPVMLMLIYIPQLVLTAAALIISETNQRHITKHQTQSEPGLRKASGDQRLGSSSTYDECAAARNISANPHSGNFLVEKTINSITAIGVYMVIFSVIGAILTDIFHSRASVLISAFLEISRGIPTLDEITFLTTDEKTALILALTSFGGLSAVFQSFGMIKESKLSFVKYIIGKCVCGLLCFAASTLYLMHR